MKDGQNTEIEALKVQQANLRLDIQRLEGERTPARSMEAGTLIYKASPLKKSPKKIIVREEYSDES